MIDDGRRPMFFPAPLQLDREVVPGLRRPVELGIGVLRIAQRNFTRRGRVIRIAVLATTGRRSRRMHSDSDGIPRSERSCIRISITKTPSPFGHPDRVVFSSPILRFIHHQLVVNCDPRRERHRHSRVLISRFCTIRPLARSGKRPHPQKIRSPDGLPLEVRRWAKDLGRFDGFIKKRCHANRRKIPR